MDPNAGPVLIDHPGGVFRAWRNDCYWGDNFGIYTFQFFFPCGDGVIDPGEQCDDGNLVDGDGCDSNCTVTACGNGIVTTPEQCEPGSFCRGGCNPLTGLCVDISCNADCTCPPPVCGDGVVDPGEQCDDGNTLSGDTCPADCRYTGALIRGDRSRPRRYRSSCQMEWYVVNPNNPPDQFGLPSFNQVCQDQDPTCDFDSLRGRCRFEVLVCLSNEDPNLPACSNNGIASVQVVPTKPHLRNMPGIVALAAANEAQIQDALTHLLDPNDPGAGYTNQAPLSASQKNFCSAPVEIEVRSGPRLGDSLLGAQTLRVRSSDQTAPWPQRRLSQLRLRCGPPP